MMRFTPSGFVPTSMPPTSAVPVVGVSSPHSIRIVVDLPAPLAPRNPKISPCSTEKDKSLTASKDPKRRPRPRTSIACTHGCFPIDAFEARLGEPDRRQSARAGQLILQQRHLCDEHVGAGRHAGGKSIRHDSPRLGCTGDRVARGADRGLAGPEIEQPLANVRRHDGIEFGDALARGRDNGSRLRGLRLRAAEIENVPVDVDADVPALLPLPEAREDVRIRIRVVETAGKRHGRLGRGSRGLDARFGAAETQRHRLALRPIVERLLASSATSPCDGAVVVISSESASSITVSYGHADQAPQVDQCGLADIFGFDQLRALARSLCLEAGDLVRRNEPDIEPMTRVRELRFGSRRRFFEHAHRLSACRGRPVGADDLETQIGSRRINVNARRLRFGRAACSNASIRPDV